MALDAVSSPDGLREVYRAPGGVVARKVIDRIDPHARRFIELSPLCCLGTADADGRCDVSPRGDHPGFVRVLDERRLLVPDRPGNNRVDSMENMLDNPRCGLLFLIPGITDLLRVNGTASIVTSPDLLADSAVDDRVPPAGLLVGVEEVFFHCGRALKRARLWEPASRVERTALPKLADMIRDQLAPTDDASRAELDELARESYLDRLY
jgi:uncharacterized protein